jgi:quercetin dioxygenase-like cupin family protein
MTDHRMIEGKPIASLDPRRDRWFLGTLMRFHATRDDTGGAFSIVEQTMPAGFSPPRHVHANEDGAIYVLEGRLTVEVGDRKVTVGPGEVAVLPRGAAHTFLAAAPSRILEITTPGGSSGFTRRTPSPQRKRGCRRRPLRTSRASSRRRRKSQSTSSGRRSGTEGGSRTWRRRPRRRSTRIEAAGEVPRFNS